MTDQHSDRAAQWARKNLPCRWQSEITDSCVAHTTHIPSCPAHYRPVIAAALARAWRERDNAEKWHQVWKQEAEMLNKQLKTIRALGDTP